MISAVPTVSGAKRLTTYGTLEIGEVPRLALMENATPNAIIDNPIRSRRYRFRIYTDNLFKFLIPFICKQSYYSTVAAG